jgi:hypothetical protein
METVQPDQLVQEVGEVVLQDHKDIQALRDLKVTWDQQDYQGQRLVQVLLDLKEIPVLQDPMEIQVLQDHKEM